jgi:Zn-dependent protease/CBS domain-containing protein
VSGTLRIGSLGGIPISIHASWLVIYALISWSLAVGYFPAEIEGLGRAAAWVSGLVAALLLFVCVLLHELSHAFVARAWGLGVRDITLHVFGGVSRLEDEPPSPRAEFLIAVAGPLTSFGLAALLWGVGALDVQGPTARAVTRYLALVNLALGIFNLIPGFPLDGGRVLRAALWRWRGGLEPATYTASQVGVGFAFGLMGVGVFLVLGGSLIGGVWMILIGMFLRGAADAGYAQLALKQSLGRLRVRDVMTREVVSVAPETSLEQLAERFWSHRFTSFPVVEDGVVRGIANIDGVRGTAREHWPQTPVRAVMRTLSEDLVVAPDTPVFKALQKASGNGVGRLAVLDRDQLVGYLSLKDITHLLVLKGVPSRRDATVRPVGTASPEGGRAA